MSAILITVLLFVLISFVGFMSQQEKPEIIKQENKKARRTKRSSVGLLKPKTAHTLREKVLRAHSELNYTIANDGSAVDNFIKDLYAKIPWKPEGIAVSGLSTFVRGKKRLNELIEIHPEEKNVYLKTYKVGFRYKAESEVKANLFRKESSDEGIEKTDWKTFATVTLPRRCEEMILPHITERYEKIRFSVGLNAKKNITIWISLKLRICGRDLAAHCPKGLTEFSEVHFERFCNIVQERMNPNPSKLIDLYNDYGLRDIFFRECEQELRRRMGAPLIGEGNITQTTLCHLLKEHFPEVISEYSPEWLGRQRIDIYIPSINVAIEYNGPQHYMPLALYGGEDGFQKIQNRDSLKRRLCASNGLALHEWHFSRSVNRVEVDRFVKEELLSIKHI